MALTSTLLISGSEVTGAAGTYTVSTTFTTSSRNSIVLIILGSNRNNLFTTATMTIFDGYTANAVTVPTLSTATNPGTVTNAYYQVAYYTQSPGRCIDNKLRVVVDGGNAFQYQVWEIAGATGRVGYIAGVSTSATGAITSTVTSASLTTGDMAVGFISKNVNIVTTSDTDTVNGSWSTIVQTSQANLNSNIAMQRKIVTGAGTQTFNLGFASSNYLTGILTFRENTAAAWSGGRFSIVNIGGK